MNSPDDCVKEDLQPIIDVFTGADGGAAFARLHHGILLDVYSKEAPTQVEQDFIKMVKQFSKLCSVVIDS